jgi:Ca-activated chloride channel family protein
MWVDGEPVRGEILEAEEARRIYDDIVRRRRDPALLEYVGRNTVQASVFPIEPGDEQRIEVEYSQVLDVEDGVVHYVYPLNTERFSPRPLEEVSVHVEVQGDTPIGTIYSPSHSVATQRLGENGFEVGYEESDVLPETDFDLYWTLATQDIALNLLTYRESADQDGFFLLMVTPPVEVDEQEVISKDVILVLDVSGSMEGDKLEQAKDALTYVLDHLNRADRFNVIAFSTGTRIFADELLPARDTGEALDWVRDLDAVGGTDIDAALRLAMEQAGDLRPTVVIFLTDGLATEGETDTSRILDNVAYAAPDNVRLFAFGVGNDVDTVLLDRLVEEHRGTSAYVREGQRIDDEVSAFYNKVSTPVLADIELELRGSGIRLEDMYPDPLPDLFAGTQLVIAGRYRGDGRADIRLSGEINDRPQTYTYKDLRFRSHAGGESFIPRLWATRKIGHLLNEIRLHGEDPELVDAVVDLSVRYGVITPYTSFLIDEHDIFTEGARDDLAEEFAAQEEAESAVSGAGAVERAAEEGAMSGAEAPAALPTMPIAPDLGGGEAAPPPGVAPGEVVTAADVVKLVGDKTFVYRNGVWIDTAFDPDVYTPIEVGFASDDYFELAAQAPQLGDYFSVGTQVIVVYGDEAFQVIEGEAPPVDVEEVLPEVAPEEEGGGGLLPGILGGGGEEPEATGQPGEAEGGGQPGLCPGAALPLGLIVGLPLLRRKRSSR